MSHQTSLPARVFNRLNPFLFFRSPSIYAEIISRLIEMGRVPENSEITLQGSGTVPRKLKKKLGSSKIVLKEVRSLKRSDLEEAIKFAIASRSQGELRAKNFLLRLETGSVVIEPLADDYKRMKQKADLRHYYEEETRKLVMNHRQGTPAVISSDEVTVSGLRRQLIERCVEQAARAAREEITDEPGLSSDRFALILCAGAVRGLSLSSDVDFILVSADKGEQFRVNRYFERLASRISSLLAEIGMRADNLVERFSPNKAAFIDVSEASRAVWLAHAVFDTKKVEQVGSEEVYHRFRALIEDLIYDKGALRLKRWRRLYLRQALRKRSVKRGDLPDPSVWLRDITISYMLGGTIVRALHPGSEKRHEERQQSKSNSVLYDTLAEMESSGLFSAAEKEDLIGSYEFFMKARNELFLTYGGAMRAIAKEEVSRMATGLGYESEASFLKSYNEQTEQVESLLRGLKERAGHRNRAMVVIDIWADILLKARPLLNLLTKGDAGVSISSAQRQVSSDRL